MTFLEKIKHPNFKKNVLKIATPFFILITVFFFLAQNSSIFFNEGFSVAIENSFSNGKWKSFFGYKIFFSIFYGIWMTLKNIK